MAVPSSSSRPRPNHHRRRRRDQHVRRPQGRLARRRVRRPRRLAKAGDNLYVGDGAIDATGTAIVQGSIERSNVSGVTQLTEMIRIQRAYQSLATLMQKQDDIRSTAINRLGDLNA
jgi:flagellar basal-body rod protein FlgF